MSHQDIENNSKVEINKELSTDAKISQDLISTSLDMTVIRYSKVWEDHAIISEGLQINKDDSVLCITSSGDNVLNLLLLGPKEMHAVDLSEGQNCLLELKIAAIKGLTSHEEFLQLIGEKPSPSRKELFNKIQPYLPKYANDYWKDNIAVIESGISWAGRLEKYIHDFPIDERCVHLLDSDCVDEIFSAETIEDQRIAFNKLPLDKLGDFFRWYYSNEQLNNKGRSSEQTKYVELNSDAVGVHFWEMLLKLMLKSDVPAKSNFYFSWFIRGNRYYDPVMRPEFAPPYLTKNGFQSLKLLVDRIKIFTASVHEVIPYGKYTKLVLSNIFEYLSPSASEAVFEIIATSLSPGAIVAYFELMNDRVPSPHLTKLMYLQELSERLTSSSRVFWFKKFNLYKVQ